MFASRETKVIDVEGVAVTICMLSGRSLDKAADAKSATGMNALKAIGSDLLKTMESEAITKAAAAVAAANRAPLDEAAAKEARYAKYDQETVLVQGIKSWDDKEVKVSTESIGDLKQSAAKQIFRAILDFSLPPIDAEEASSKG